MVPVDGVGLVPVVPELAVELLELEPELEAELELEEELAVVPPPASIVRP